MEDMKNWQTGDVAPSGTASVSENSSSSHIN